MFSITEVLMIAFTFSAIIGILKYSGLLSEGGIGTRLILVSIAFLIITVGFESLIVFADEIWGEMIIKQIEMAEIYLCYSVAGITAIIGGLLIAIKSLFLGSL